MKREQNTLEDVYTHIFNGGLVTKVIEDVVHHDAYTFKGIDEQDVAVKARKRRNYKLQFRLTNLDHPMTVTVPLFSVCQVDALIQALGRTLERMVTNIDDLGEKKDAMNDVYARDGRKIDRQDMESVSLDAARETLARLETLGLNVQGRE